jgi:hypothetical protein
MVSCGMWVARDGKRGENVDITGQTFKLDAITSDLIVTWLNYVHASCESHELVFHYSSLVLRSSSSDYVFVSQLKNTY